MFYNNVVKIKNIKRRIKGVPQSLDAAYPRNQEEETKLTGNEYSNKCFTSRTISPLFSKRGQQTVLLAETT